MARNRRETLQVHKRDAAEAPYINTVMGGFVQYQT